MNNDLDLEAAVRLELTRLIDHIDVDAPLPSREDQPATGRRSAVAAAVVLVVLAAGAVAILASGRSSQGSGEVSAAEPATEHAPWSSAAPGGDDEHCPLDDVDGHVLSASIDTDRSCEVVAYVHRDGHQTILGRVSGGPPPETIRLTYIVEDEPEELTIATTSGDEAGGVREWSARVPEHVPELIDPVTGEGAVDFKVALLDSDGNPRWEVGLPAPGLQKDG